MLQSFYMRFVSLLLFLNLAVYLLLAPIASTPPVRSGSLSRYDPGVMERVNEWRHTNGIPSGFDPYSVDYDGFIAVEGCVNVGKTATAYVTIERVRTGPYSFYISDCADNPATVGWMHRNKIAAEIDYEAWVTLGIVDGKGAWVELTID